MSKHFLPPIAKCLIKTPWASNLTHCPCLLTLSLDGMEAAGGISIHLYGENSKTLANGTCTNDHLRSVSNYSKMYYARIPF